jgi:single-stranded DNA-specific DHH superfamily exonuclease
MESGLITEKRWLLEGHNLKGNDSSYVRTSQESLLQEYLKAVNELTINEENRLKIKVQKLEKEKDKFDLFAMKVADNFRNLEEKLMKIKTEGKEITNHDFNHALNEFGYTNHTQSIGCDEKGKVVLDFDDCDD